MHTGRTPGDDEGSDDTFPVQGTPNYQKLPRRQPGTESSSQLSEGTNPVNDTYILDFSLQNSETINLPVGGGFCYSSPRG